MGKAPKAPGKNGASTPEVIFEALDAQVRALTEEFWRTQMIIASLVAASKLFGAKRVAPWLTLLGRQDHVRAEGLAKVAEGTARAGAMEDSEVAIAECRIALRGPSVDGERGTLAWRALAFALHVHGDTAGVDEAIRQAVACAHRDKSNPTQPWPHLVRAYWVLGRDADLYAHFRSFRSHHLSYEDVTAAGAVVSRAVERGDVAGYRKWREVLDTHGAYEIREAMKRSALAAVRSGHGEALFEVMSDFATQASFGDHTAWDVCLSLTGEGHIQLARRILAVTRERFPRESELLASLARDLGTGGDPEAQRGYVRETEATHPGLAGDAFIKTFRARYALDKESALRVAELREAALRAELGSPGVATVQGMFTLGVALASAGESERGLAMVDEAVKLCAGLKGADKSSSLQDAGRMLAAHGLDEQCLTVLRKMTSMDHRTELAKLLSLRYVRAKDYAGAVAVVGLGEVRPPAQAMRLADVLSEAAGVTREFDNYR